jgi:cytochrome c oxidase cbb3-type subunit 3
MSSDNKNKDLHVEKDEVHLLLDHNYDGIHELDNPLPSWWQFTFYGAIIFSIFYFIFYLVLGGPTLRDEYNKDYAVIVAKQEELKKKEGGFDPAKLEAIIKDDGAKKGEVVFQTNCVACHKEKGTGDIGPNLTDDHWIWANGTAASMYPVVFNGIPQNGMPTWGGVLSNDEIYQAIAYVATLHNTNQAGGKAPQGYKIVDGANGPERQGEPVGVPANNGIVTSGTTEAAPAN